MFKISSFNTVRSWRRIGLSKGLKSIYNKALTICDFYQMVQ